MLVMLFGHVGVGVVQGRSHNLQRDARFRQMTGVAVHSIRSSVWG
jgi:hypothetical protein